MHNWPVGVGITLHVGGLGIWFYQSICQSSGCDIDF